MSSVPPGSAGEGRLERCIRDLAALNALPAMCIGRSPGEALALMVEALPTALSADLIFLRIPGASVEECGLLHGRELSTDELGALAFARLSRRGESTLELDGTGPLWCFEAEVPIGKERGLLLAGRHGTLDVETDRVLVRSAANLVGATLENANVLEAAQRKDEFLAVLGHELRNPLAPILTAVELLARRPEAERERQVIERNTRHLARLVDDLLDISRVTRGQIELKSEPVSLASVLERAVDLVMPAVTRFGHTLAVGSAGETMLQGDSVRLVQVFGNLLNNSAKFTAAGGRIEVLVEQTPKRVAVTVRDNGRGIARESLARIFEPFVQAHAEEDRRRGGLGLGLAIVRDLVTRHGGSITAHSEGRGRGASFRVELPVVVVAERRISIVLPEAPEARHGVRVLVVDDNADVAELLSEALEAAGFQTAVAFDARAALEIWRDFVPHAGVLDVGLPEVDGYELAKTLRTEHGTQPTLIAATGYGGQQDRKRAADAGFDFHFVKPVSVRDLVVALDKHVIGARAGAQ
ncbi:MAG TPA: hybrid sensor histidine kinase/response regulator [Polyangiaceae bacterium]|jgi:signal transduction histidine kinase/ActR/RegA family two-component response regulator|nr:hybrid sensor histidine kinase/response regulator [Polyangiaceae bacterium]